MAPLSRQARLLNSWCIDMSPTMIMRLLAVHCRKSFASHGRKSHTYGLYTCSYKSILSPAWHIQLTQILLTYSIERMQQAR